MENQLRTSTVPSWSPPLDQLDDVELLLSGAYAPLRGFLGPDDLASVTQRRRLVDGTPWPVPIGLVAPPEVAEVAACAGALELLDEEGTPIAELVIEQVWAAVDGAGMAGPVRALRPVERGAWRRCASRAGAGAPVLAAPLRSPLPPATLGALRARAATLGARLLLLPLVGQRSPRGIDAAGLVRACHRLTEHDVDVVPVPLPRHRDTSDDDNRLLAAIVARNIGATQVAESELDDLPAVVDLPTEHVAPGGRSRGLTVLFSGLSGSGKSTLARAVHAALLERTDRAVTMLDGDLVRRMLSAELTFSRAHRELNVRRIGFVAAEVARHGGIALCAPIAPYAAVRAEIQAMTEEHGDFVLVHVSTPLEVCKARDRKGLYARARRGEIPEFTGISDPYEPPLDADLTIDTSQVPVDEAVELVLAAMKVGI